jgi:hypothetical protein
VTGTDHSTGVGCGYQRSDARRRQLLQTKPLINPLIAMSVYLQSLKTEKFVKGPKQWTDHEQDARQFGGSTDALFYCYEHQLPSMQILGRFEDRARDFTIPLQEKSFE